ncbi:MAG: hypothetical protein QNJ03_09030 [Dinoroseobacter sp.]|nr:hypothetical protein [Dinoroseobacter sp.]
MIAGVEVIDDDPYTKVWLEGSWASDPRVGGEYRAGEWWVGIPAFSDIFFLTKSPPPGQNFFETDFELAFVDPEQGVIVIGDTVEMSLVPVPPALASMGLGLLVLGGWRRLKAR